MKKTYLLGIICLTLANISKAQEKVKIGPLNIEIKSTDINGQAKFLGSSQKYYTRLIDPLLTKTYDDYLSDIGSFRKDRDSYEAQNLFNLSNSTLSFPLLDSIDFYYYVSFGFERAAQRNPELAKKIVFDELKEKLSSDEIKTVLEKKKIFVSDKYKEVRLELLLSRLDIIPTPFTLGKQKVTTQTADLKLQIDAILAKNYPSGSVDVKTYLYSLVDEKINVEGTYYSAKMRDDYISTIEDIISSTKNLKPTNEFNRKLKIYIQSTTAAANSGLYAIQLTGTYNKNKINKDTIATELSVKYKVPADVAVNIGLDVSYKFTKEESTTLRTQFSNVFILRYTTSKTIDELNFKTLTLE